MSDKRQREVATLFDEHNFGEASEDDVALMGRILATYFNRRTAALGKILDTLPPGRSTPSHKVWMDRGMDGIKMVQDTFDDAPESCQAWAAPIAKQEHNFFLAIYQCPVAQFRDKMVGQGEALEKAKAEFESKWKDMLAKDDGLEDKMKRAGDKITDILYKAAQAAAKAETTAKEKVASAVKAVVGVGTKFVDLGATEYAMKAATDAIAGAANEVEARKMEIMVLLSLENQIFATFTHAREAVDEFLEENGYTQVKDAWDEGKAEAAKIEAALATSGQKDDVKAFVADVGSHLEKVYKEAETNYKEFATKHQYLFFGPLGSSWHRQLGDDDMWKQFSDNWKNRRDDLDDLLRDAALAVERDEMFGVDLDELTDEQYKKFETRMKDHARQLLKAWNDLKKVAGSSATELVSRHRDVNDVLDDMR